MNRWSFPGVEVYKLTAPRARDSWANGVRYARIAAIRPHAAALGSPRLPTVERSALVTFTPAQMYALVNDVPRYPEFLPWCVSAQVEEISTTERLASVKAAKGMIRMQFTTRNTLKPDAEILMQLADGPFSRLTGRWNFDAVGERGSRVLFHVDFEFKSRMMAAALNPMFQSVCDSIVDAFVLRAQSTYR
jgi:ribosome-associated toxin RatA of RatAB toxin-antitoxin module